MPGSANDVAKGKEIIDKAEPGPDFKVREKNFKNATVNVTNR